MSSVLTHKHQYVSFPLLLAVVIAIIAIAVFVAIPYITSRQTAIVPAAGNQNAYSEYLRGEKVIFAMPARADNALFTYRIGEKTFFVGIASPSDALTSFRLGEKHVMSQLEYALLTYHLGEKEIQ